MWLFAYVPHRPSGDHQYNAQDNVYKMTNVTGGILRSNGMNLAIPLLNQHLHNIHHLYPQLPFTRYGAIWAKHKDALIAAGTEIHPIYSSSQGSFCYSQVVSQRNVWGLISKRYIEREREGLLHLCP
jgi:fatty acid desaturase